MNEVFAEYIVKCRLSLKMFAARIGLIWICILLSIIAINLLGMAAPVAIGIIIYVGVYVWGLTKVEYEYSILNSDLTIDAIYGQKARRRKMDIDLKNAEMIAYVSTGKLDQYAGRTTEKNFSSLRMNVDLVGIVLHEKNVYTEVFIEPNERVLDAIKMVRPNFAANLNKQN